MFFLLLSYIELLLVTLEWGGESRGTEFIKRSMFSIPAEIYTCPKILENNCSEMTEGKLILISPGIKKVNLGSSLKSHRMVGVGPLEII